MDTLMLWPPSELPIPAAVKQQTWAAKVVKQSRKAVRTLYEKMQLNFFHLLEQPVVKDVVKRKRKSKKRAFGDWENDTVFTGSITLTLHRSEEDQRHVLTEWSNSHLWEAHCWVFDESMEALKAVGNSEEKKDILEWIFSPSFIEKAGKTIDKRPCLIRRHASDIPFSFVNCCRAVGITDPEAFREKLVEKMSDEFRPKLEKYLQIVGTRSI